jgi:hypothetical protein
MSKEKALSIISHHGNAVQNQWDTDPDPLDHLIKKADNNKDCQNCGETRNHHKLLAEMYNENNTSNT